MKIVIFLMLLAVSFTAFSQPVLVKDINSTPLDVVNLNNYTNQFRGSGERTFIPFSTFSGSAWWKSDGTVAGTGTVFTNPIISTVGTDQAGMLGNDFLVLAAVDHEVILYKVPAGADNAVLVKSLGIDNSTSILRSGSEFMFSVTSDKFETALYKTDGTTSGTVKFKDLDETYFAYRTIIADSHTYMQAFDKNGNSSIVRTDGTEAGTVTVWTQVPGDQESPNLIGALGSNLIFSAYNWNTEVYELYRSDGTEAGTSVFSGIPDFAFDVTCRVLNGSLIFGTTNQLWKTDGTDAGTVKIGDFGARESIVYQNAYYAIGSTSTGVAFMKTDGASLSMIKDFGTGFPDASAQRGITIYNGKMIVPFYSQTDGSELGISDGTAGGTVLLKDIKPGSGSSKPRNFTAVGDKLVFIADDGIHGTDLWVTDGTSGGTSLLKEILTGTGSAFNGTGLIVDSYLNKVGDRVSFLATEDGNVSNMKLFVSDGTNAGTVKKLESETGRWAYVGTMSGDAYYRVGVKLVKVAGATGDASIVKDLTPENRVSGNNFDLIGDFVIGNKLIFYWPLLGGIDPPGAEYWITDGTTAGTHIIKDNHPAVAPTVGGGGCIFNNKFIFAFNDGVNGVEPWITDGTEAGTKLLKDLNPGVASAFPSGEISRFVRLGNKALFLATVNDERHLFITDGTEAGTVIVPNVDIDALDVWIVANDQYAFIQTSDVTYGKLWKTNGTESTILKEWTLDPEFGANTIFYKEKLYFVAKGTDHGRELWVSDGTTSGTKAVRVIASNKGSNPQRLREINGVLFFGGFTETGEETLWYTSNGETFDHVGNLRPGAYQFTAGKIWFIANSPEFSLELFTMDPPKLTQTITFESLTDKPEGGPTFNLSATSTSSLPIIFTATPADRVSINGNVVTILKPGSVTFIASQPGNELFNTAAAVERKICITPLKPTITVTNDLPQTKTFQSSSTSGNQWYKNGTMIAGATAQTFVVTETASYTVVVTIDQCTSAASEAKAVCIIPAKPTITMVNDLPLTKTLQSSSATGNQWYKNGTAIANETTQTLVVANDGSYTVKVTLGGCTSDASDAKVITIVGLDQELNGSFYPNPVKDKLFVQWSNASDEVSASIIDMTGRTRHIEVFRAAVEIPTSDYTTGVYILRISAGNRAIFSKFLKE